MCPPLKEVRFLRNVLPDLLRDSLKSDLRSFVIEYYSFDPIIIYNSQRTAKYTANGIFNYYPIETGT